LLKTIGIKVLKVVIKTNKENKMRKKKKEESKKILNKVIALGLVCTMTFSPTSGLNVGNVSADGINYNNIDIKEDETIVWSSNGGATNAVRFPQEEDWNDWDNQAKLFLDGNKQRVKKGSMLNFDMTISGEELSTLSENGYLKIEVTFFNEVNNWDNVVKLGWPMYYASNFTDNGNDTYSCNVSMEFGENLDTFGQVIIRSVGTLFEGDIDISNISIVQLDSSEDYVEITEKVKGDIDMVDTSKMAKSVTLVDANATDATKALASYMTALREDDKVLFGHQNSTFRSVRDNGETSDIKDITGSEAGLFGIDTLALAGCETAKTTTKEAIDASVEASLKAYNGGSLITLSCHMPNFTNSKIVESDDEFGYDFTKCDFMESKDLTPCADYILEGGMYNDRFNAYLDIIAKYADRLQEKNIPVLFRPFHENSGGWFWWGTSTSVESYKSMWRYMVTYLENKGVHNFIYVYSPNGPFENQETYLERYPGDSYVDVIAFDYYDDYADKNVYTGDNFFKALKKSCEVVVEIADEKGKIPAIAETGIRITGAGKDSLMVSGNPTLGHDWYNNVVNTAVETGIPYFLLWANFDSSNFFVPFKFDDDLGQEMINEFISAYNNEKSIFGNGTLFYVTGDMGSADAAIASASTVTLNGLSNKLRGYLIEPKNYVVIKEACEFSANVSNANIVNFVIKASEDSEEIVIEGNKEEGTDIYVASVTEDVLKRIGKTSTGSVEVYAYNADNEELFVGGAYFINFNKDVDVMPENIIDNFEYYYGNDAFLNGKWGDDNSATGCSSVMSLSKDEKSEGGFGGAFNYTLSYKGSEVWTGGLGRVFEKNDYSEYNAISMWVKPDGNGQKMVIQLNDYYEAYLTDFVKGTESAYVTIPLSSFIKKGGTESISVDNITNFKLWCNSIPENYNGTKDEDGHYVVNGQVVFDDIRFVKIDETYLDDTDDYGLIISKEALKDLSANEEDTNKESDNDKENDKDKDSGKGSDVNTDSDVNVNILKEGTIIKDKKTRAEYVVLESTANGGKVSLKKALSKKIKKIVVPKSIKKNGITYKVTEIANGAFKNNKKLKKVVIGKNVIVIGKKAFFGCKKLKSVIIKTKELNKIGKKAFYRVRGKRIHFKIVKGKKKAYKNMIKKSKSNNYKIK